MSTLPFAHAFETELCAIKGLRQSESSLEEERRRTKSLSDTIHQLEETVHVHSIRVDERDTTISALQHDHQNALNSVKNAEIGMKFELAKCRVSHLDVGKQRVEAQLHEERIRNSQFKTQISQLEASVREASDKTAQHQQTISLLVSEKTTLTSSLERLEQLEPSSSPVINPQ